VTCSNASNIKMTLTMILDLLPHEEIPVVFLDQADVVDVALLWVMNDGEIMNGRGLWALLVNLTLNTPCLLLVGLKDMISLVTLDANYFLQSCV
jgi:hypothetical protein